MPSAAQTGGSTEPNGGVLNHEKEELMDTHVHPNTISMMLIMSLQFLKGYFPCRIKWKKSMGEQKLLKPV